MINYWRVHGHLSEGRGWLERAIRWGEAAPSAERARALGGIGWFARLQGDFECAGTTLSDALDIAVAVGAKMSEAWIRNSLAVECVFERRFAEAAEMMDHALGALSRAGAGGYRRPASRRAGALAPGLIARLSGDPVGATYYLEAAERRQRELGHAWGLGESLHYLGDLALDRGDLTNALARFREMLELVTWVGPGDPLA